jgi:glycosyltransferase involved in cell wall biosynthesis
MKIAILSMFFPPERGAPELLGHLATHLVESGHDVHVVTTFPSYPKGEVFEGFEKRLVSHGTWENGIKITRLWSYTSSKRTSFLHRSLQEFSFAALSLAYLLLSSRSDLLYVATQPYYLGLVSNLIFRLRGSHSVLHVADFWPDVAFAVGRITNPLFIRFLRGVSRFIYRRASLIIAVSPLMRELIIQRGADPERVVHNYTWTELGPEGVTEDPELREKLGLEGKMVVLFAGNIGNAQGLEVVICAAERLSDTPEVQFVLLGDGNEKASLVERARERRLENVRFLDPVPSAEVPRFAAMADLLLLHLVHKEYVGASVPGKTAMYMSAGKAILAGARGAAEDMVVEANAGWTFTPEDPDDLARVVRELLRTPRSEIRQRGVNGRTFAEANLDRDTQCGKIESHLRALSH